jgi:hypothetical protein
MLIQASSLSIAAPAPRATACPPQTPAPRALDHWTERLQDLEVPTYSKVLLGTVADLGKTSLMLGATAGAIGAALVSPGYILAGLMDGNFGMLAAGVLAGGVAAALVHTICKLGEAEGKAEASHRPNLALPASDIPGGTTLREVAAQRMSEQDPDLLQRIQPGRYVHPGQVWTWGYKGETLGHLHAEASHKAAKNELHARGCDIQRNVNLGIAAAAGAGTLSLAVAGVPWLGLGLAAAPAILFAWAAVGCGETKRTAGAVAQAHRLTQQKLESFGAHFKTSP